MIARPLEAPSAEVWLSPKEVRGLGMSARTLRYKMENQQCVSRVEDGKREVLLSSLPLDLQRRFSSGAKSQADAVLPKSVDRQLAYRVIGERLSILDRWAELSTRDKEGILGERLREDWATAGAPLEGNRPPPHPVSLDRVLRKSRQMFARGENGGLATLGRKGARVPVTADPLLPEEARSYLLKLWLSGNLTKRRVEKTYREEAKRRDWPQVSYSTISRVLDSCPGPVLFMARKGTFEYRGQASPCIRRDDSALAPGAVMVGDHHELDLFGRDDDGNIRRPWFTAFADQATGAIVGWVLCWSPSRVSIKEAFARAVRPKFRPEYERMCGVPKVIYVDNGKDYRSHDLEGCVSRVFKVELTVDDVYQIKGLFPSLDIEVWHAIVRNAKAKIIERTFGVTAPDLSPMLPGYCGRDRETKPAEQLRELRRQHREWMEKRRQTTPFLTLSEIEEIVEAWVFEYNTSVRAKLCREGRELSPVDAYRLYAPSPVLARDHELELLLMPSFEATVQKEGVRIEGTWYWSDELADLYRPTGKKVRVTCRRDPAQAGSVYCFGLNGEFICQAINAPVLRTGASQEELSEAMRAIRQREKRVRQSIRELTASAPTGAMTALEALMAKTPPMADEPFVPADAIRKVIPSLAHVPLRQKEPPKGPAEELLVLRDEDLPPAPSSAPLYMFDSEMDEDEECTPFSAQGGQGGEK